MHKISEESEDGNHYLKEEQSRQRKQKFKSPEARTFCVKTARRPQVWLSEEGEW